MDFSKKAVPQENIIPIVKETQCDQNEEYWITEGTERNTEIQQNENKKQEDEMEGIYPLCMKKHEEFEITPLTKRMSKKDSKPNPEFELTFYNYKSNLDLALFDYYRDQIQEDTFRFNESCFVLRYVEDEKVYFDVQTQKNMKTGLVPRSNGQILFHIKLEECPISKGKKFFTIVPQNFSQKEEYLSKNRRLDKKLYKAISQSSNHLGQYAEHEIQKGDEIKFGIESFKVIDIQFGYVLNRNQKKNIQIKIPIKQEMSQNHIKRQDKVCRICLANENSLEDPLLTPCLCKGTCEHVHFNCLRTWLSSHLVKENDILVDSYKWTKMECQICKTEYPFKFLYLGKLLELVDYPIPDEPYVAFERLRPGCRKQILVVKGMEEEAVLIGRNMDCDWKILVNTVSRVHATIEFIEDSFYLKDLGSKYGTSIRVDRPIRVEGKLRVQVGDMLMRFDLVMKKQGKEQVYKYN